MALLTLENSQAQDHLDCSWQHTTMHMRTMNEKKGCLIVVRLLHLFSTHQCCFIMAIGACYQCLCKEILK